MKYLIPIILALLMPLGAFGQTRGVAYDFVTRNVFPTDLDYVGASGNFTNLTQAGVSVVTTARTIAAGVGLTGGGDLSANRTLTLDLSELVDNQIIFDGANATRTITFNLSAGDPVLSLGSGVFNISSGTLQQGGNPVATSANNLSFFAATTSAQFFGVISDEVGSSGTAIRVTGTASNGFVPVANGAGVVTWTAQSGSGSGAPVGTMVNSGTPTQFALPYYADTTGTNMAPSALLTDATGTNFYAGGFNINTLTVTNPIPVTSGGLGIASGTSGGIPYFSGSTTIASSGALTANAVVIGGGAGAAPSASGVSIVGGTNLNGANIDASATGMTVKQTKTLILQRPDYGDGVGAIPQTNTYTASGLMHFTFSGNAETNGNWAVYEFDCPADLDTAVEMTARFAFLSGGTDADDYVFHLTFAQQAPGAAYVTGTSIATSPIVMTITPTTAANGDLQQSAATTLTGWAAALTAGRPMQVRIARLQNTQDDSARDVQLVIAYGSTL